MSIARQDGAVDQREHTVFSRSMTRKQLREFLVTLPPCIVATESCGTAHHWARYARRFGHTSRIVHARTVIEAWRIEYNTERPHSSLGNRTPEEVASSRAKQDQERVSLTADSNAIPY
jgi:transposase InsO family protein